MAKFITGRKIILIAWLGIMIPYFSLVFPVPFFISNNLLEIISAPIFIIFMVLLAPIIVFLFPKISRLLPESLDIWFNNTQKIILILWGAGVLFAWFSLGSIAVYLMDAKYTNASLMPENKFLVKHSCLTAYIHGTILSQDPSMNVYDLKFVDAKPDDSLPETAKQFKPFKLDAYGYPPPFLLFPKLILLFTGNYFSIRAFVGGLSLIFAIFSIFMIAKTLGGIHEKRIYIFTPFLVSTPPMLITIQVGNFHLIAISLCLLIWVYSEKNKFSLSGTLLAIATISKIFPGLLGVLFIIQKQYRIILATIVAAIAICGISYIVFGSKIWHDFIFYHLPHVQTGRALSFMVDGDQNIEFNLSPFGIPFKLAALGIFNFSWNEAKIFGNIFSIFLLGIGIIAGRKKGSPQFRLSTWIALVMFASLRSPFAGAFVILTVSFLLLILVSEVNSIQSIIFFILAYIAFSLPIPVENSKVAIGISFVRILLLYSFLLWIILRKEKAIPY